MEAMQKLLSEFHSAPSNVFQEKYQKHEAELIFGPCDYSASKMRDAVEDWIKKTLPDGVEQYEMHYLYVDDFEYEIETEACINLITRIISEKMTYEQVLEMMESEA